jgi:Tol biopolymer transport system component
MPSESGQTLLHYRLLEKLGEGGMGVVWKALDTKLDREVAIKILPEEMAGDPERMARFEREAKSVAALNHPNIVTIHSVEEAEGIHFITMELVRGKSLTELIPKNGLPLAKFFELSTAMADAISTAHQQGITHRDLKPDNVMVGDDGRLKILDFGLAKLRDEAHAIEGSTQFPTATVTQEGKILGSVSYMSPEQAEGKSIDHRSDIFSMGVVLYQMATGQRPFKGDTSVSIISSIMKDTPESITDLNQSLPRHLGRIVKRCLAKEPGRRFQTALDLRNELEELKEEIDSGELPSSSATDIAGKRRIGSLPIALIATAIVVVLAGYIWLNRRQPDTGPLNPTFTQLTFEAGEQWLPSLMPDGKSFVYVAGNNIYMRRVGGEKAINLTEDHDGEDTQPTVSPDGESIAFRSEREGGGIFIMGATGESVRRLSDFGYNPAWSPDGSQLLVTSSGVDLPHSIAPAFTLWVIDIATGERKQLTEGDAIHPQWSPHGHRIAYWSLPGGQRDLWTIPASGGEPVRVTDDDAVDWKPVWSPDGGYLYFSSDRGGAMNLWRIPIDERSGEPLGEPQPVTTGAAASRGHLSIAADGRRLAYVETITEANLQRIAFDPKSGTVRGRPSQVTTGDLKIFFPSPSPDGEWIAFQGHRGQQEDVYVVRADGSGLRRLTDDIHKDRGVRWSPDGERIAFFSNRSGSYEIWTIKPDGSELRQITDIPDAEILNPVWSPDGSLLHYARDKLDEVILLDLSRSGEDRIFRVLPEIGESGERMWVGSWSPDGRELLGFGTLPTGGTVTGLVAYSLEDGEYRRVSDKPVSGFPMTEYLKDGRRALYRHEHLLYLLDLETRESREVLALDPPSGIGHFAISADNETLYFVRMAADADIWMLTLE